jgi:hypothetical protein
MKKVILLFCSFYFGSLLFGQSFLNISSIAKKDLVKIYQNEGIQIYQPIKNAPYSSSYILEYKNQMYTISRYLIDTITLEKGKETPIIFILGYKIQQMKESDGISIYSTIAITFFSDKPQLFEIGQFSGGVGNDFCTQKYRIFDLDNDGENESILIYACIFENSRDPNIIMLYQIHDGTIEQKKTVGTGYYKTISNLNLRDNPGLQSGIKKTLDKGIDVKVIDVYMNPVVIDNKIGFWEKVIVNENENGWLFSVYLK